jgi:hypothetical protein
MCLKKSSNNVTFSNVVKVWSMINLTISKGVHATLLPIIINHDLLTQQKCYNMEGIIGRHVRI